MAKSFKTLKSFISSDRREKIEERAQAVLLSMALQELRQSRHLTQGEVALILNMNEADLSKLENQNDISVSTLRKLLSAMGGNLKIVAEFPEGDIVINQFEHARTG